MKRNEIPTEHDEQKNLFTWAGLNESKYPGIELMFAIPNGGNRHIVTAKKLKSEGVKPGVPDVFLPVARSGYHGLWIEMKRIKGGSLSGYQKAFISDLKKSGYQVSVCKGWEDAVNVIKKYMG